MTVHVAFLDRYAEPIHDLIQRTATPGWRMVMARSSGRVDQLEAVRHAEIVFAGAGPVDQDLIANASHLRLVQKLGVGVDNIDLDACRSRGIAVARLAGGNAIPVAEHVVLLMLATLRRLPAFDVHTRSGAWLKEDARSTNRKLEDRRIGLIGFGHVGKAVAQRLTGFGVDVCYYDIVRPDPQAELALGVTYAPLQELLTTSDVVSLHVPLLPTTRGLIGATALGQMKDGAILVNCARGGVVDEDALATELSSQRLFGAGLDVFATEPPVDSPLLRLSNTVVTPHLAGATVDNFEAVLRRAFINAGAVLGGASLPPDDVVVSPGEPSMSL